MRVVEGGGWRGWREGERGESLTWAVQMLDVALSLLYAARASASPCGRRERG